MSEANRACELIILSGNKLAGDYGCKDYQEKYWNYRSRFHSRHQYSIFCTHINLLLAAGKPPTPSLTHRKMERGLPARGVGHTTAGPVTMSPLPPEYAFSQLVEDTVAAKNISHS
jgi:hypothetical protein